METMGTTRHTLAAVAESADEVLFHCTVCPRKIVVKKRSANTAVIEEGDEEAQHVGSLSGTAGRLGGSVGALNVGIVP